MKSRSTLSKKLGGSSFNGTSIYDGVFSGSAPFRPSSLSSTSSSSSSRPEDYAEIFGGSRDSRRSSIPVLDVPALHERKAPPVDVRSSKLEYTKIFGGGSDGEALSYEDVAVDHTKMRTLFREEPYKNRGAHTSSSSEISFNGSEDNQEVRKASHPSTDNVTKQFNVSYNRTVGGGGRDGINGTTHIAQLHDVPGYACVVDENNPSKQLNGDKFVSNGGRSRNGSIGDQVLKDKDTKRSKSSMSLSSPDKQRNKDVFRDRSPSSSSLSEGYEFGIRREPSNVQGSSGFSPYFNPSKGNSRSNVFPPEVPQGGVGMGSPTYFEEEIDANSVAAASADAVRKAIEKAQAKIKIAKEMMERRKEGFAESMSLREQRKSRKKEGLFREVEPPKGKLDEFGKVDSTKTRRSSTGFGDVGHSNNVAAHTLEQLSTDSRESNLQGGKVDGDGTRLYAVAETDETVKKNLENKQSASILKMMQLTDDGETRSARANIERTSGISTTWTAVEVVRRQEIHEKTESRFFTGEAEGICQNQSDKSGSIGPSQDVEVDELKLEVNGHHRQSTEPMTKSDQGEGHGNLEEYHESLPELKLGAPQLEEKTLGSEDCDGKENEEKRGEDHELEGSVGSRVEYGDEENAASGKILGEEEYGAREVESHERECGREQNREKHIDDHGGVGSVGSRNISDGKEENASFGKIVSKEENRDESTSNRDESKKEYTGFSLGADARQWLDHMKEILNVRINSFLDAKENSRFHETSEVENNLQYEAGACEKIPEEICWAELIEDLPGPQESMVDERITIEANMKWEDEEQDAANEGEVSMERLEVSGYEDKESVDTTRGDDEDKEDEVTAEISNLSVDDDEDEVTAEVTELSVDDDEDEEAEVMAEVAELLVEERQIPDVMNISVDDVEAADVSVEQEEDSFNNLEEKEEEACGSETSDLTGPSLEADEKLEEFVGFSRSDVKLGFTGIKFRFLNSDYYAEKPEVDGLDAQLDECCVDEKLAEVSSNEEEELEGMSSVEVTDGEVKTKTSGDDRWGGDEVTEEDSQRHVVLEPNKTTVEDKPEMSTSQFTTLTKEKEMEDDLKTEVERERDERKEREREREKERQAVERAIREARERAFAEARERAERAAVEKATAEARQRVMAQAREKSANSSSEAPKKPSEKTSAEARLRAERAAVERATAEARERALEKAMSEKLSGAANDNKARARTSHEPQHRSSGPSNNNSWNQHRSSGSQTTERSDGTNSRPAQPSKAVLDRHQRTAERAAKALAEKNMRDLLAQREQAEKNRLAEALDMDIKRWSSGKQGNLRALLSTLQYILGPDSGWQPVTLTEIVPAAAVKKAYRKATLCVHPDKLQQRGASLQQKYICEKVFDLLKEAWNRFSADER